VTLSALWGSSFLFMRLAADELGALPTAGLRVGLAALFLLPILLWRGHWPALRAHYLAHPVCGPAQFRHSVCAAVLGGAVHHHRPDLHPERHRAAVWRAGGLGLAQGQAHRLAPAGAGHRLCIGVALLAWDKASFKPGGTGWAVLACLVATLCYGIGPASPSATSPA
jgi:drug/metabolite transporter (DMT)-like permease